MTHPRAAMLVIGDEILSGRTRDANMHHLAQEFTKHGIELCEVRVVLDDANAIQKSVRELSEAYDHVVTSGGIGPTHDDITADNVAAAFNVPISVRADARAILQAHYAKTGVELNDARLRMARIPDTATLIENPISSAPGFSLGNVHVMAGVPAIFQAMVAAVLPRIDGGAVMQSKTLRVDHPEGEIAKVLGDVAKAFSDVSIGSYPFIEKGSFGSNVVVRSRSGQSLNQAMARLVEEFGGQPT